jgi:hypothetical protein
MSREDAALSPSAPAPRSRHRGAAFAAGLLIAGGACAIAPLAAATTATQSPPVNADAIADPSPEDEQDADNNGYDLTRPQNSIDARLRYQTSSGTTSRTDRETVLLRFNSRITLDADWKLATLAQLPITSKTTTTSNPAGTDYELGVGDAAFQAALIRAIDTRWAVGFGARLVAPSAQDNLGSGKWQIMPGGGVRYSLPALGPDSYFVPAIRYAFSFAGDPSRRTIRQPQIAPTLNIGLPDRWFVTLFPSYDIRINYGDPVSGQTGRLFLPADLAIGRKVTDKLTLSLEASEPIIKDYPVYDFKIEARLVFKY